MKISLAALAASILISVSARAEEIPKTFLQTDNELWHKILDTPVSIVTKDASPYEAIKFLTRQTDANVEIRGKGQTERISLELHKVPLRVALYRIQQVSDLRATWKLDEGFPRAILITPKAKTQLDPFNNKGEQGS